jgi:hypothetical protein
MTSDIISAADMYEKLWADKMVTFTVSATSTINGGLTPPGKEFLHLLELAQAAAAPSHIWVINSGRMRKERDDDWALYKNAQDLRCRLAMVEAFSEDCWTWVSDNTFVFVGADTPEAQDVTTLQVAEANWRGARVFTVGVSATEEIYFSGADSGLICRELPSPGAVYDAWFRQVARNVTSHLKGEDHGVRSPHGFTVFSANEFLGAF